MATVVEELAIALGFQVNPKGLDDASTAAKKAGGEAGKKFVAEFKTASKALAVAGGVVAGAAAGVFKLVDAQTQALDKVAKGARAAGLGAAEYQRLAHGAKLSGVEMGAVAKSARFLEKSLSDATRNGTSPQAEALRELSLNTSDFIDLPFEQRLGVLADALAGVTDEQHRTLLQARLLGEEGGPQLATMLADGSRGLQAFGEEAQRTGQVVGGAALSAAENFQDELTRVKAEVGAAAREVAMELLPAVQDLIPLVVTAAQAIGPLAKSAVGLAQDLGPSGVGLTAVLGGLALALGGIPGLIAAVGAAAVVAGAKLAGMSDDVIRLREETAETERGTDEIWADEAKIKGRVESGQDLLRHKNRGTLHRLSGTDYDSKVEDLIRSGASKDLVRQFDDARAASKSREELVQYTRDQVSFSKNQIKAQGETKKRGGGGGTPQGVDLSEIEAAGIAAELRKIGEEINATPKAITAALESAAGSLASGAARGVASEAGVGTLSSLTGRDLTTRTTDPLLSELGLGDALPAVPMSTLDRGMTPQVLLSTINNNFDIQINNTIDGARDPSLVAGVVTEQIRAVFSDEIQAASKTAKVNFVR